MSTLLFTLGRWSYRHPWRVLVAWLLLLALAIGGVALLAKGTSNSFSIPGTESQAGLEQLERTFPQVSGSSAQAIVTAAPGDVVTDPSYVDPIGRALTAIGDLDGVAATSSPFDANISGAISDDDTAAILRVQFDGQTTSVSADTKTALAEAVDALGAELPAGSATLLGGELFGTSVPGVSITEALGLVIALVVLIVTFRSFVVAGLPLATALLGVGLSMALIFVATAFAPVSSTTPLLALMLGLAVGIDYALFIIARHQDQVRDGVPPEESAARATGTAGSAVVFAGITVLIALIGLAFAGIPFLTTMGVAAAGAVAISVAVAVTLTPAILGFTKGRVGGWRRRPSTRSLSTDSQSPPTRSLSTDAQRPRRSVSARWVGLITRRPLVTTLSVVALLGIAAIPATSLALALPNAGQLAESNPARQAYDLTAERFGPGTNGPLIMTGTIVTSTDPVTLMNDLAADVAKTPGVARIALATPNQTADTGIIQVIPETAPDDPATAQLVRDLRAQHDRFLDTYGVDLSVTGFTAISIDISDRLGAALVPFGIFVVGLSLILLMIVFRSIWVPVKAALGYLLSVAASFGIVAAVFEWGWFADALHVTRTGPIISFMPIVLMGVLFGLAMDYEMFLVTRMREDFVHARRRASTGSATDSAGSATGNPGSAGASTGSATETVGASTGSATGHPGSVTGAAGDTAMAVAAVRSGYVATARVVTAAAVIMFAVFAAFVPEGDANLKPIALGLASGILIDAFLVRMTLVPAVMTLLGRHAWWMPRWLDRRLPHFDIEGEAVERELALGDWPEPNTTAVIAAADLHLDGDAGPVFAGIDLRVEPGDALVLHSADTAPARAAALVLAGRLDPSGGRLRVAGHLLPGRAAWVRAHVGVAGFSADVDPVRGLARALRGGTTLIVVDGLDRIPEASRAEVVATLRGAALTRTLTVVAVAADVSAARVVLAGAGYLSPQTLDLSVVASEPASGVVPEPESAVVPEPVEGPRPAAATLEVRA